MFLLLFFFIIDAYFFILAVIAQTFIPSAELVIPSGIKINEANAETKTQPVTVEIKEASVLLNFNTYMSFYTFLSLSHYDLFQLKDNFLFHLFC